MTKTTIDDIKVDLAPERRTPVPPGATGDEGKAVDIEWLLNGVQWTEPKETNGVRIGILAAFATLREERDGWRKIYQIAAKHNDLHLDRAQAAEARVVDLEEALKDPIAVHVNMLRGTIAKPSVANIRHVYGNELDEAKSEIEKTYQRGWADAMERARVRIGLLGLVTVFTDFEKGYHRALVDAACDIRAEPLPTAEPPAAQQK